MIEEFIHTSDGKLVNKHSYIPFTRAGQKVRMIDSKRAAMVSCEVKQGAVGIIDGNCVEDNKSIFNERKEDTEIDEVYVMWPAEATISGNEAFYYCHPRCIEPVVD